VLQLGPGLRVRFAVVDSVDGELDRYESSVHDPLTHVFNGEHLASLLPAVIDRARRANGEVAALLIAVDALEATNERYGRLTGDRALCTVAASIQRALRVEDVLARQAGDQFVVLAVGTDHAGATQLAERLRLAVEALHLRACGHEVLLTTSTGVASLAQVAAAGNAEAVAELLVVAVARMDRAGTLGGNRVCTLDWRRDLPPH